MSLKQSLVSRTKDWTLLIEPDLMIDTTLSSLSIQPARTLSGGAIVYTRKCFERVVKYFQDLAAYGFQNLDLSQLM